jgi:hypothetical protein
MTRSSVRSAVIFIAGVAFGICLCLGRFAVAQGDENAFKFFATAATLSLPDAPEALRSGYVAGVYDATAVDAIATEFAKNPKKILTGKVDCLSTNARGKLTALGDWAYAKWSSTEHQAWSGASVLAAECQAEGYY